MKRVIILTVLMMVGTALLGCQQGVTDVGNPTINKPPADSPAITNPGPTVGQLIGGYGIPTPTVPAGPPPDGDTQAEPAAPTCLMDAQQTPSIAATSNPTLIILSHFLDYGSATENILASYDAKTGAIAFDLSESSIAITSCTGTADKVSDVITVSLQCKAAVSGDPECQVTFNKN